MSIMEASKIVSSDKATVVIQVNPQVTQNAVISDDEQKRRGSDQNTPLTTFLKAQPKALGTVQIMTAVVIFSFGIVCTTNENQAISVYSGITYWGSFIYIIAGSLSVAAQNKLHLRVVKISLKMNVLSALTALVTITLLSIEFRLKFESCFPGCPHFEKYDLGITGILLVFSILQLFISIWISGFACKAVGNSESTGVSLTLNQGY